MCCAYTTSWPCRRVSAAPVLLDNNGANWSLVGAEQFLQVSLSALWLLQHHFLQRRSASLCVSKSSPPPHSFARLGVCCALWHLCRSSRPFASPPPSIFDLIWHSPPPGTQYCALRHFANVTSKAGDLALKLQAACKVCDINKIFVK